MPVLAAVLLLKK